MFRRHRSVVVAASVFFVCISDRAGCGEPGTEIPKAIPLPPPVATATAAAPAPGTRKAAAPEPTPHDRRGDPARPSNAVRWECLPRTVSDVCVAPDGRLWIADVGSGEFEVDVAKAKSYIERHFRDPQPRHSESLIALLDDRSRVWICAGTDTTVLGYDGRRWIERAAIQDDPFLYDCATRGQWRDGTTNLAVNGVCYFRSKFGVHRFDGENWTYQDLRHGETDKEALVRVFASPDGRQVAACRAPSDGFWTCRDGSWTRLEAPFDPRNELLATIVTDQGVVWYLTEGLRLRHFHLADADGSARRRLPALLKQLSAGSYEERDAATIELLRVASLVQAELKQAMESTTDTDVRRRIERALDGLDARGGTPQTAFGRRLTRPTSLFQDGGGRIWIGAADVDDAGHAVLFVQPDGTSEVVADPELTAALTTPSLMLRPTTPPVPVQLSEAPASGALPAQDAFWVSTPEDGNHGGILFDVAAKQIVARVDEPRFSNLRAVGPDGRLFVGPEEYTAPVFAFDRHAPDLRRPLPVTTAPFTADFLSIAGDGAIWARRSKEELIRFDGREWKVIEKVPDPEIRVENGELVGKFPEFGIRFVAGTDGLVIVGRSEGPFSLYEGDRLLARSDSIPDLIRNHRQRIAAAFRRTDSVAGRGYDLFGPKSQLNIAADRDGNIWLRVGDEIQVLVGERWEPADPSLKKAGAVNERWNLLTLTSDDGDAFVSNLDLVSNQGKSFLGRVEAGKPVFRETTNARDRGYRDANGKLWIGGDIAADEGGFDRITGSRAFRFDGRKIDAEIKDHGFPILVDRSNRVWLARRQYAGDDRVSVVVDGQVRQEIRIPQTDEILAAFSDRPGSVYLRVACGLQHMAADTSGNGDYRPAGYYAIEGVPRTAMEFGYSRLGYFVVYGHDDKTGHENRVTLVELPKP